MSLDILISGIGIAGPIAAYWLLRANPNHRITIVERDNNLRTTGQSIDIRQPAVDIIRSMGLQGIIKERSTNESGISFVDGDGEPFATFESSGDVDNQSFSSEFEVLRGDLVQIFFDKIKDDRNVTIIFGEYVEDYKHLTTKNGIEDGEDGGRVEVIYANGRENEKFDLIIACDGQSSRIRRIMYDTLSEPRTHFLPFYQYCAYYTYTHKGDNSTGLSLLDDLCGDGKKALWYNSTGGRVLFIRPDPIKGQCRANIIRQFLPSDEQGIERYRNALSTKDGNQTFQEVLKQDFKDAGWISQQLLDGFEGEGCKDFYASETAQIRVPSLVRGRVALVGDAGYCPTPLTGMGTSLAIIGSYILAGELSLAFASDVKGDVNVNGNGNVDLDLVEIGKNLEKGLENYNLIMKPFSAKIQNIPTIIPRLANPQTAWGLWLSRTVLWFLANYLVGLITFVSRFAGIFSIGKQTWKLPVYPKFQQQQQQQQQHQLDTDNISEIDVEDKKTK